MARACAASSVLVSLDAASCNSHSIQRVYMSLALYRTIVSQPMAKGVLYCCMMQPLYAGIRSEVAAFASKRCHVVMQPGRVPHQGMPGAGDPWT